MSNHQTPLSANGRRDPSFRAALIINAKVARQIEVRAALRETGIFSLLLSCESAEIAKDVLENQDTPDLLLILLDFSLATTCLQFIPKEYLARTVLTHEPEISVEGDAIALPHPVSAAVILDVIGRLGAFD